MARGLRCAVTPFLSSDRIWQEWFMALSIVPPCAAEQAEGRPCNLRGFEAWGEEQPPADERDRAALLGCEPAGCSAARRALRRGEVREAARRTKRAASPFDPLVVEVVRRALAEFSPA